MLGLLRPLFDPPAEDGLPIALLRSGFRLAQDDPLPWFDQALQRSSEAVTAGARLVDAYGGLRAEARSSVGFLLVRPQWRQDETFWSRHGEPITWLLIALALAPVGLCRRRVAGRLRLAVTACQPD